MFFLKAWYCRLFQTAFRLLLPLLPYREPTRLGSCAELPDVLRREKATSLLLVTDKGIVANGLLSAVEVAATAANVSYTVFDDTEANPTVRNVEDALRRYREHRCDGILAVGGGSAMDCAKAVGARVVYPQKTVNQLGGKLKVRRRLPLWIAVPTTAGTGSETTLAAMITDPDTHRKYALMSFPLIPHYAVLDATLTESLPPFLTAATGMDALTHAVEAYIGRSTTKETRALATEAVALIFRHLPRAYADGHDRTAREQMLLASYKAGVAFSKSYVGYVHALAHALGGRYGTPHGLANAVLLPHVLEAYGARVHKKLHALAVAASLASDDDPAQTGAKKFLEAVRALNAAMGIPETLSAIRLEDIDALSTHAAREANPLYPVPKLMTKRELAALYHRIT
ncbi:MAG: iron-containing alcohol dehydrogenase [Clostridia bacterium]|nr:iron-containing alcohol dehydrogenase [Clostridia bacterium]